jgi:Flp pilus assembly secretin CpaC
MNLLRIALMMTSAVALASISARADEANAGNFVRINYDQSSLLHLDRPAKTVIVGNASVADAQLINERTIYVLGRTFGNTNIIAVDAAGGEVMNTRVTVGTPEELQVTLYRGPAGQRNLACAPQCERTITPGDADMTAMQQDGDKKIDVSQKASLLANGH